MRIDGRSNVFAEKFGNQCTYWASERYHQLTGVWVPMTGNAYEWTTQARANGWIVKNAPPAVPSIICLQGNAGQGILSDFGHVAIAERVNADGTVHTSNYNWPISPVGKVTYVTFHTGPGVSFIYAGDDVGRRGVAGTVVAITNNVKNTVKVYSLASNATVAEALSTLDKINTLYNPFDVDVKRVEGDIEPYGYASDNSSSFSFSDPVGWLSTVSANIINNSMAIIFRFIFLVLGVYLLFRVMDHYMNISGMVGQGMNTISKIGEVVNE